ncbi:adenosine deaminase-like protein [Trypanosoma brucei brucei TREU927]|uniref:tRNA-specific adenosine deaminase 1 n=1 Tax=Trypanosoma brucei brucei (strain 927/4 GUTat10.1) TaxID=185431 RepID=Q389P9_TRYB2|nr:adenosine deaminase-like protein [Trypanosoma brucei brucei TREU927]EAN78471.1 adenosine deaminase-like protein [Trypanosoma brucei brucei TREU927]
MHVDVPHDCFPGCATPLEAFAIALRSQPRGFGWDCSAISALDGRGEVVAGFVLGLPRASPCDKISGPSFVCVSLGSGTRCVGYKPVEFTVEADLMLRDGHAEVMARRGLVAFLLDAAAYLSRGDDRLHFAVERHHCFPQFSGGDASCDAVGECFRLRPGVSVHLVCTEYPCGAMSTPFGGAHVLLSTPSGRSLFDGGLDSNPLLVGEEHVSRCDGKTLPEFVDARVFDGPGSFTVCYGHRVAAHRCWPVDDMPFVARVKPGKGRQNLCMSCSDKLLRWHCLGIQGRRRTRLFPEPIRLAAVWLPRKVSIVSDNCVAVNAFSPLEKAREGLNSRLHCFCPRLRPGELGAPSEGTNEPVRGGSPFPQVDVCDFESSALRLILVGMSGDDTPLGNGGAPKRKDESCWSRAAWATVEDGNQVVPCSAGAKRRRGELEGLVVRCVLRWNEESTAALNTKAGVPRGVTKQSMNRTVQQLLQLQSDVYSGAKPPDPDTAALLEGIASRFPLSRLWMALRQREIARTVSGRYHQSCRRLQAFPPTEGEADHETRRVGNYSLYIPQRVVSVGDMAEIGRNIASGDSVHCWLQGSQRAGESVLDEVWKEGLGRKLPLLWVEKREQRVA